MIPLSELLIQLMEFAITNPLMFALMVCVAIVIIGFMERKPID
jgi:hypothetical protein